MENKNVNLKNKINEMYKEQIGKQSVVIENERHALNIRAYKNVQHYWYEWAGNTSLHGIRYLGERGRHIFERLWWLIVLVIALSSCSYWIVRTYNRWTNNPVTVTTAISTIPFPAVTICPTSKVRRSVYNVTHYIHEMKTENLTGEELKFFNDVVLVCHDIKGKQMFADENSIDSITEVAPKNIIGLCIWDDRDCTNMFTPILTEEGVCYTFNMLDTNDIFKKKVYLNKKYERNTSEKSVWTLESGYSAKEYDIPFPRRTFALGLEIILTGFDYDHEYSCRRDQPGFKILLHRPDQTPRVVTQYLKAGVNQEMIVSVKPTMIQASYGLRDFPVEKRKCYFSTERALVFYQNYTQENCEIECVANYTLSMCDCVAFHMPRNETTKICGGGNRFCMDRSEYFQLSKDIKLDDCNCLPDCVHLSYTAEISQAAQTFLNFRDELEDDTNKTFTQVTIFFKEREFIASQRNELYSFEDFLANCGGLLGLFVGFSFMSLAETVYFLTLRLWCNARRYGRHYWSGSTEFINNGSNN